MSTAAADALARVQATPTNVCTYRMWVSAAVSPDRATAFRVWGDRIIDLGFEVRRTPELEPWEHDGVVDWWVVGGVVPVAEEE